MILFYCIAFNLHRLFKLTLKVMHIISVQHTFTLLLILLLLLSVLDAIIAPVFTSQCDSPCDRSGPQ